MFGVPLASPWWSTVLRREIPGDVEDGGERLASPSPEDSSVGAPVIPGSMLKVILHTRFKDRTGLAVVEREIPYVRGILPQIRSAVSELARPGSEGPALLPEGTRVLDVAYARSGTVYIDFSAPLEAGRDVGAAEERVLIQGIVSTIVDNFSAVRRVVILVEGKVPKPGHLDLTRALRRDDPVFSADEDRDGAPDPDAAPVGSATKAEVQAPPKPPPTPSPARPAPTSPAREPTSSSH